MEGLIAATRRALAAGDVDAKLTLTRRLASARATGRLPIETTFGEPLEVTRPGRPEWPRLVAAAQVPRRGFGTLHGRAALLHAIAHIEFTAVNLALDAVQRFSGMPDGYYDDWSRIAGEEAHHFVLVRRRLRALDFDYGDFDAHAGIWEMAEKTADDVLARMALVPRVLEARGLDVTPGIAEKLRQADDDEAVAVLDVIQHDEIGHVAAGTHWFHHCCVARGLDPETTFFRLVAERFPDGIHGPFAHDARRAAGFSESELERLDAIEKRKE